MKNFYFRILVFIIFFFNTLICFSQALKETGYPPIKNFSTKDYKGEPQNWCIVQDKRGIMYFGNNGGILEYDGVNWSMLEVSNNSNVRSLAIDNTGRIYAGANNEFGYLAPDKTGNLKYVSLLEYLNDTSQEIGEVWSIFCSSDGIYFHTHSTIYLWNGKSFKRWEAEKKFQKTWCFNNTIYIRQKDIGLQKISGDSLKMVSDNAMLKTESFHLIPVDNESILVCTRSKGFFLLKLPVNTYKTEIIPFRTGFDDLLLSMKTNHSIKLGNNYFSIGSSGNGVLIMNHFGELFQVINKKSGLQDEVINFQYLDKYNNLWLALDNGLSRLDINSHISFFNDKAGVEGTIEAVTRFNNTIYIATNLGVFYLDKSSNDIPNGDVTTQYQPLFRKLEDINNKCWSLLTFTGKNDTSLLIAENNFIYELDKHHRLSAILKCEPWVLYRSKVNSNRVFAGLNNGLASVYYSQSGWIDEGTIAEIVEEIRCIDEDVHGNLWLGTINQGIIELKTRGANNKTTDYEIIRYDSVNTGLPGGFKFYYEHKNWQFFATMKWMYKFNSESSEFVSYDVPGIEIHDEFNAIHRASEDYKGNLWLNITGKNRVYRIGYIEKTHGNTYKWNSSKFSSISKEVINSIYHEPDGITWLGGPDGLFRYNDNVIKKYNEIYNTLIRKVITGKESVIFDGTFSDTNGTVLLQQPGHFKPVLNYTYNSVTFYFASQFYEFEEDIYYSCFLEGYDNNWNEWNSISQKEYTNLDEGTYIFKVKAKNVYSNESRIASFEFTISPPWYRTTWAYAGYIIIFVLLLYIGIQLNTQRLRALNIRLEKIIRQRTAEIQKQKEEIQVQRDIVSGQKRELEAIHEELTASIRYAKRIQSAVLPGLEYVSQIFAEYFILFKPRDIVSGDFFWLTNVKKWTIFCVADCTGHGVPGAFMSMLGISFLNEIVRREEITQTNHVLNELRRYVIEALQQKGITGEQQDGMDIAIIAIKDFTHAQNDTFTVQFTGANNPLWIIRHEENRHVETHYSTSLHADFLHADATNADAGSKIIEEIKGDKMPVAVYVKMDDFTYHSLTLKCGDRLYLFSDGYFDQSGGPKGKKFMYKRAKQLLSENRNCSMQEQKEILDTAIKEWMGYTNPLTSKPYEQVDDICVAGIQLV